MQVLNLFIEREGNNIATTNGVVIKHNTQFRYIFVPSLVDNPNDPTKNVRARIIVQKKKKNENWEDFNSLKLSDLRAGEYFNVDIPSESLDIILNYCSELKKINNEYGLEYLKNTRRVMIVDSAESLEDIRKLINLIFENPNGKNILSKLVELDPEVVSNYLNDINNVDATISKLDLNSKNNIYNNVRAKLINTKYIEENINNYSENFWQDFFTSNPSILSTVIPCVFQLIVDKPFLGGKSIDNKSGIISDYMYKFGSNNSCLIEIKTPMTKLMNNTDYRNNIYSPSSELTGAIIQAKNQKDSLNKEYYSLKYKTANMDYEALDPKVYLIIGNASTLNPEQLKNFELFRRELKDIEIITFDELIKKLKLIENALLNS